MNWKSKAVLAAGFVLISSASVALAAGMVTISQKGLTFSEASVDIAPGTIVTFMNDDTTSHNILVTGNGVTLNSGLQSPGVPFKAPFLKAGAYQVMCGIHPKMKMTVNVK